MKKIFTLVAMVCMSVVANAAFTFSPDVKYTSIEELNGKTFAIVNEAEGKAYYGTNAQNLGYDVYEKAFVDTNSGYMWKIVKDDAMNAYYLQLVTPDGSDYNCWNMGGVLNSQGEGQGWGCSFILGTKDQKGQDIPNGALYELNYTANGWTMKNVGTGMYTKYSSGPANSTEPTYWTFCSIKKEGAEDPIPPLVEVENLKSLVANKTVFTLKNGDSYAYGPSQQNIAIGTWAEASAASNNANGYVLENDENYYYLRAVKADGSNISAYGTNPCWLNNNGGNVVFNLGKNQDVKNGSSWLITETSQGNYALKNVATGTYLAVNGAAGTMVADPVEWQFCLSNKSYVVDADITVPGKETTLSNQSLTIVECANSNAIVTLPAATASIYTMESQSIQIAINGENVSKVDGQVLNFTSPLGAVEVTVTDVQGTVSNDKIDVTVTAAGSNGITVTVHYLDHETATNIGIVEAAGAKASVAKFVENGRLVIVKAGKQFNAAGALLK